MTSAAREHHPRSAHSGDLPIRPSYLPDHLSDGPLADWSPIGADWSPIGARLEPEMGFEPMTCALRVRCSTTELPGPYWELASG